MASAFLGASFLESSFSGKSRGGCSGQWLGCLLSEAQSLRPLGDMSEAPPVFQGLMVLRACPAAQQAECGLIIESSSLDVCGPFGTSLKARAPVSVLFRGTSGQTKGLGVGQLCKPLAQ